MRNRLFLIIALLINFTLSAFELEVTVTNETCPGNGNLQFSVVGQAPNAVITYAIYLLPNATTPVITTNDSNVNVQVAGNYLVVASQLVNGITTSDQKTVAVISSYVIPQIGLTSQPVLCGSDGNINVYTISGAIANYQILSGPITTNYQSSNNFTGLPTGSYVVRAIDNCGNTAITSTTLTSTSLDISITDGDVNPVLTDCNINDVKHTINGILLPNNFPLTIQTTYQLPSGGTSVSTQVVTSGNEFILQVPVDNQNISLGYSIQISTACGTQYIDSSNIVNAPFDVTIIASQSTCGILEATFEIKNGKPPFTINYLSFPAGFNPIMSNSNHPGPFVSETVTYENIPAGNYSAIVSDSCGKTNNVDFIAVLDEQVLSSSASSVGCTTMGDFCVTTTNPPVNITNAVLTSGPPGFTYPFNISSFISENKVCLQNVTVGNYSIQVTDVCGNIVTSNFVFETDQGEAPLVGQRPSCALGEGAVIITSESAEMISVEIVEAPILFGFSLPYNVNFNIAINGNFYMNSLPAGFYKFKIITDCGFNEFLTIAINGYAISSSVIQEPEEVCGGFNLFFNQVSNGVFGDSFHLQKYSLSENTWEHPTTGVNYDELVNIPDSSNALLVQNGTLNSNIGGNSGQYRIVKTFFTYNNGSVTTARCVSEVGQFIFEGGPKFIDAFIFPCSNNSQEVVVIARGLEPLQYRIIEKDGLPFIVNNGTQNNFPNLSPGLYRFEFEDSCGFIRGRLVDITILSIPTISALNLCPNENGSLEVQGIAFIDYKWYKQNNPTNILSTSNVLSFPNFNIATNAGIYIVELTSENNNSCINQPIMYEIKASDYQPNAGLDATQSYCVVSQTIDLEQLLSNPHDPNGVWTDVSGTILSSTIINVSSQGTYSYNYTVNSVLCAIVDTTSITVILDDVLVAPTILVPASICIGSKVQLGIIPFPNATYSWTGPNGFTASIANPIISNFDTINNGLYSVTVTASGCNYPVATITLTSNPKPEFIIDGVSEICTGQQENLSVIPQNFALIDATYQWLLNGQVLINETQNNINITQFGTYEAKITLGGCVTTKDVIIEEKLNSFDINLMQNCSGIDYFVNVTNSDAFPAATFIWTGPNGFSSVEKNITISNNQLGLYNVIITNQEGCQANETIVVVPLPCQISNVVTPNSDGSNDFFDLSGLEVKKLLIYNRFGRLVYEKEAYLNEWIGQNKNGKLLPDSTYFYQIDFSSEQVKDALGWLFLTH